MALTKGGITIFDSSSNLIMKHWASEVWRVVVRKLPLKRFHSKSPNSIIQVNDEFTRVSGTTYYFQLGAELSGMPRIGDAERAGHEEQMSLYDDAVTIDMLSHGVALKGRFEEQKYRANLRVMSKDRLGNFFTLIMDEYEMGHLCGNTAITFPATALAPTSNRYYVAGQGLGTDSKTITDITASDLLDVSTIRIMKYNAWNATVKVPTIIVDGKEKYVMFLHPTQLFWLKEDAVYNQILREAHVRGSKNPIYTGSITEIDGVVLHSHEKLLTGSNAGSGANLAYARGILCGSQAALMAKADKAVKWHEEMIDRGNKYAIWGSVIFGIKKSRFSIDGTATDYGVFAVDSYAPVPVES